MHSAKLKVDGITKYIEHNMFRFDHSFAEEETTEELYRCTTWPLVEFCLQGKGEEGGGRGGRCSMMIY